MTQELVPEDTPVPAEGIGQAIPQWSRTTRLLAVIGLIIAAVYGLTLIAPVMQMLAFAFLLTFVMYAPTRWMSRRVHLPWALSVVLMYILLIVIIAGSLLVVIPNVVSATNALIVEGEQAYADLRETLRDYTPDQGILDMMGFQIDFDPVLSPLRRFMLGDELITDTVPEGAEELEGTLLEPISLQQLLDGMSSIAGSVSGTVTSAITTVTGFVGTLLLAIFLSFLILIDWPNTQTSVQNWVTDAYQYEFRRLMQELLRVWNGFFRGQVAIGGIVGIVTWLQLTIMGIEGAEILALITGVISLIPTLGGIISLIPLGFTALLRGSTVFVNLPYWSVALLVIGINIVLSQIVWNVGAPLILGDALDLPLPVIVVGVFIGAAVGGILGAFLVAPIMGTMRVILEYAMHKIREEDPYPPEPPPSARKRLARQTRSGA
ncbi:MAG: AI-2E family transporter [Anaerolineae bacterium]|nr:AI-2E family transporter [Anaerolineae bacterium]